MHVLSGMYEFIDQLKVFLNTVENKWEKSDQFLSHNYECIACYKKKLIEGTAVKSL